MRALFRWIVTTFKGVGLAVHGVFMILPNVDPKYRKGILAERELEQEAIRNLPESELKRFACFVEFDEGMMGSNEDENSEVEPHFN